MKMDIQQLIYKMAILLGIFLELKWLVISELLVTVIVGFVMFNIVCTGCSTGKLQRMVMITMTLVSEYLSFI
ncbi:hypothetical protein POTOM_004204 [Populus tomentosa]|uniref:Uncharacterized protein n=1 Tax=Populus tomentosa TaxID=118781 RepID=A0A8X8DDA5_POPTO|nr:hypothetical protein POTOM_004204 [Populus tomentosa]